MQVITEGDVLKSNDPDRAANFFILVVAKYKGIGVMVSGNGKKIRACPNDVIFSIILSDSCADYTPGNGYHFYDDPKEFSLATYEDLPPVAKVIYNTVKEALSKNKPIEQAF